MQSIHPDSLCGLLKFIHRPTDVNSLHSNGAKWNLVFKRPKPDKKKAVSYLFLNTDRMDNILFRSICNFKSQYIF